MVRCVDSPRFGGDRARSDLGRRPERKQVSQQLLALALVPLEHPPRLVAQGLQLPVHLARTMFPLLCFQLVSEDVQNPDVGDKFAGIPDCSALFASVPDVLSSANRFIYSIFLSRISLRIAIQAPSCYSALSNMLFLYIENRSRFLPYQALQDD